MRRLWALGLVALPLVACKAKAPSDAPTRDVRSWTIAEIEAELAHNDRALAGEGIVVAAAAPMPEPEPAPSGDEAATAHEQQGPSDDDAGTEPSEVAPEPIDTGPTLTSPSASPEPEALAERTVFDGLEQRAGRRRAASRSRRDGDTRCERICGLSEATCDLEAQICELAARHPEEPRYRQACLRAEQQCEAATSACQRCEG